MNPVINAHHRWLQLFVFFVTIAGCTSIRDLAHRPRSSGPDWRLSGPECAPTLAKASSYVSVDADAPREAQVLEIVCLPAGEVAVHDAVDSRTGFTRLHARYDDRRSDPVIAAVMVTDCVRSGFCRLQDDPFAVAMMQFYAHAFDDASLRAALQKVAVSEQARASFLTVARLSQTAVLEQGKVLSPAFAAIFVQIPEAVAAERKAYFERYSALYARLDPILEKLSAPGLTADKLSPLVEQADALRERYLKSCGDARCRFDPFFVDATLALAGAQAIVGATFDAYANIEYLLDNKAPPLQTFSSVVTQRQLARLVRAKAQLDEAERLRSARLPEAQIAAKYPDASLAKVVGPGRVWSFADDRLELSSVANALDVHPDGGKIRALSRLPDGNVSVAFADQVEKIEDANCRETDHVQRYEFRGTYGEQGSVVPVYDTVCGTPTVSVERRKIDPVVVPEHEARALQPGQQLFTLTRYDRPGRESRVLEARSSGKTVVFRGLRSPPEHRKAL